MSGSSSRSRVRTRKLSSPRVDASAKQPLQKARSGVRGLDEITGGGLPRGRPTLVCGGPGCGKTLFAMEFLVRGAMEYDEPGVFMAFEETPEDLAANVASLGFDVKQLEARKKLTIDFVRVERSEIEETGEYDLEGLFVRLGYAIDEVGAKRVVLDTIESLFAGLPNPLVLRSELRRLFRWLKDRGMTVVITGEQGNGQITRQGLEEYVSDCVIFLDHRVQNEVSTRRLRIVKYRGTVHGTNEYPFLIGEGGISVLPVTSIGMKYGSSTERVSTGIPRLDEMLGGKGYFKGSTVLVSGTAGTGKTTMAAQLAQDFCRRGRRCLYFAYEEAASQIQRNMTSVGLDLAECLRKDTLRIIAVRPQSTGLEMHLAAMQNAVSEFAPELVIMDPISNLLGTRLEARSMLTRLIDLLKGMEITTLLTNLTSGSSDLEETEVGISSLIDTWIMLEVIRSGGERNRIMNIIKSRGMAHSNQTSEFKLTSHGVQLADTYLGASGVLTGSARLTKEAEDRAAASLREYELAQKQALRESRRKAFESRMTALREEFAAEDAELERAIREQELLRRHVESDRLAMAKGRMAFDRREEGETDGGR